VFPIYGIAATSSPDKIGEMLDINGADLTDMRGINDEHSKGMFATLGAISKAKKIYKEDDCEDEYEKKCWQTVKKPFIYIYGNLTDNGHPNAAAAQSLIKFSTQNPHFNIGFSVEGATLKREGQKLLQTKILGASLTVKPCNTDCHVWAVNNLMKSESVDLPDIYKNNESRRSFREMPTVEMRMKAKIELLKKSQDLMKTDINQAGIVKCWNCGEGKLFMKSRLPNSCTACKSPFSMSDIYSSLISEV
jgi:hypothetical protein